MLNPPTVKQKVLFLAVLYTLIIGCVIIFTYRETDSYPPRDKFGNCYHTVGFKQTVCYKCHKHDIGRNVPMEYPL